MNREDITNTPQYKVYNMNTEEFWLTLVVGMGTCFIIGMIFYENILISFIFSLVGTLYLPVRKRDLLIKHKEMLNIQFKDMLYFLSVSLSVGNSLETAIFDAEKSMEVLYPDTNSAIMIELGIISQSISFNQPVEKAFYDLAQRSGLEDIKSFANVISVSKRAGANLVEVIKNTSDTIREKIEIRQEIDTLLSGKKFEYRILSAMPFAMVIMLKETGSGFLDPLMTSLFGRVIMTIALLMVLAGLVIARKIMNIEV